MFILAHFDRDRRSSARRSLRLETESSTPSTPQTQVVVHDLSQAGLLIEASVDLSVGDRLEVHLPEAGTAEAEVVWSSGRFFGCRFAEPISAASVSAALLKARPARPDEWGSFVQATALEELQTLRSRVRQLTEQIDRVITEIAGRKRP
jgi:PilZ domain-containing protein